jgi:hypothetical protein
VFGIVILTIETKFSDKLQNRIIQYLLKDN